MRMHLETSLQILIVSLTIISSSYTHVSSSRKHFGKCLSEELSALLKIITLNADTNPSARTKEGIPRIIKFHQTSLNNRTSGRRIFFWPWAPRWWSSRFFGRPFGIGAGGGFFGGIGPGGIGIHGGVGAGGIHGGIGHYHPGTVPGFGTPGIGVGIGGGLGAGYHPGVGLGIGAGVGAGIGSLGRPIHHVRPDEYHQPQPINNYDQSWHSDRDNYLQQYPIANDNYEPVFPPPSNDFIDHSLDSMYDQNIPSAVGYEGGPDHIVGYDRTSGIHQMKPPQYFGSDRLINGIKVNTPLYESNYNGLQYREYQPKNNSPGQIDSTNSYSLMDDSELNSNKHEEKQDRRFFYDKDINFDEIPLKRQLYTERPQIVKSTLSKRHTRNNDNFKQLANIHSKIKSNFKVKVNSNNYNLKKKILANS